MIRSELKLFYRYLFWGHPVHTSYFFFGCDTSGLGWAGLGWAGLAEQSIITLFLSADTSPTHYNTQYTACLAISTLTLCSGQRPHVSTKRNFPYLAIEWLISNFGAIKSVAGGHRPIFIAVKCFSRNNEALLTR